MFSTVSPNIASLDQLILLAFDEVSSNVLCLLISRYTCYMTHVFHDYSFLFRHEPSTYRAFRKLKIGEQVFPLNGHNISYLQKICQLIIKYQNKAYGGIIRKLAYLE